MRIQSFNIVQFEQLALEQRKPARDETFAKSSNNRFQARAFREEREQLCILRL